MCKFHEKNPSNVFICDVKSAKLCVAGARRFLGEHNHSFEDFLYNGIDPLLLLQTGDRYAAMVVEAAYGRQQQQRSNDGL